MGCVPSISQKGLENSNKLSQQASHSVDVDVRCWNNDNDEEADQIVSVLKREISELNISTSEIVPVLSNKFRYDNLNSRILSSKSCLQVRSSARLERFLGDLFSESPILDGLKTVLYNSAGRKHFEKFIRDNMGLFINADNSQFHDGQLEVSLIDIVNDLASEGMHSIPADDFISVKAHVLRSFKPFLSSTFYQNWRKEEIEVVSNLLDGDIDDDDIEYSDENHTTIANVFHVSRVDHLLTVLYDNPFLFQLIFAMENAPISFTIVNKEMYNNVEFPIIYANKYFEYFTGHDRMTVIQSRSQFASVNFLPGSSGHISGYKLDYGDILLDMRDGQPCNACVKCVRQNGDLYDCFILVQPTYNKYRKCNYIACFQVNESDGPLQLQSSRFASWLDQSRCLFM